MKVLFLYVSTNMCRDGDLWYYDEGVAGVAAAIKEAGHGVAFRMVRKADNMDTVLPWIKEHQEEKTLIVFHTSINFSAFGHDLPETYPQIAKLKEITGFPVAFVGIFATFNPEKVLEFPGVDIVGRGEVDGALVDLCNALDHGQPIKDIPNLWVKEDGKVYRNDFRELISDINELPFPSRDLLPAAEQANERDGILTMVCIRGCPKNCNFCANSVLRNLYKDKGNQFSRLKSVDYVIGEVKAAVAADPNLKSVFFHDDLFCFNPSWTEEFFARFPKEINLPYGCNLIMSQVKPDFATKLRKSGCRQVQIGIESGSEYMRNKVIEKGWTMSRSLSPSCFSANRVSL